MPNTELLQRTLRHIENNPTSWDQTAFYSRTECGTSHCFAGWAVVLSGVNPRRDDTVLIAEIPAEFRARVEDQEVFGPSDAQATSIATAASALLGVAHWYGNPDYPHLFDGGNTLDDLRAMVAELCAHTESEAR